MSIFSSAARALDAAGVAGFAACSATRIPLRALIDPRLDGGNFCRRQARAVHRHRDAFEPGHHAIQAALVGASWNDRGAVFAAADCRLPRAQVEIGQLHVGAVTVPAAFLENRLDVASEGDGRSRRERPEVEPARSPALKMCRPRPRRELSKGLFPASMLSSLSCCYTTNIARRAPRICRKLSQIRERTAHCGRLNIPTMTALPMTWPSIALNRLRRVSHASAPGAISILVSSAYTSKV